MVIVDKLNGFVQSIGRVMAWANVILIGIIITQVVMRYGFNKGMVPLEELMWHFYAIAMMFGLSYAFTTNSHIRVDLFHMRFSPKKQALIEIFGIVFLLLPFLFVILDHSISWAWQSYQIGESSENPTGLPYRWVIKSVLPLSFLLLFIAAIARLIQSVAMLISKDNTHNTNSASEVSS